MEKEVRHNQNRRDKVLKGLLEPKSRPSFQLKPTDQQFTIKESSRMRRRSQQLIKDELLELQKRHGPREKKTQKLQDLQSSKVTYKSLKQLTYERVLKKDLQAHYKSLQRESQAITPEQEEQLGYVTFKMVKQKEKHYFSDLRDKINSGTVQTMPNKGRMSLPVPPSLTFNSP